MRKVALAGVAVLVTLALAGGKCSTEGGGDYSTDLPIGKVVSVKADTGTTYEICVEARYTDKGFTKGRVYCRGHRSPEEAQNCKPRASQTVEYPKCKQS